MMMMIIIVIYAVYRNPQISKITAVISGIGIIFYDVSFTRYFDPWAKSISAV
jgi:hypothetical protein